MSLEGPLYHLPRASAATRPLLVFERISSRSTSATLVNTVSTMRPAGDVVLAHGSAKERRPAFKRHQPPTVPARRHLSSWVSTSLAI